MRFFMYALGATVAVCAQGRLTAQEADVHERARFRADVAPEAMQPARRAAERISSWRRTFDRARIPRPLMVAGGDAFGSPVAVNDTAPPSSPENKAQLSAANDAPDIYLTAATDAALPQPEVLNRGAVKIDRKTPAPAQPILLEPAADGPATPALSNPPAERNGRLSSPTYAPVSAPCCGEAVATRTRDVAALMQARNFDAALSALRQTITHDPGNFEALAAAVQCHSLLGERDEAVRTARGLQISDGNVARALDLADALHAQGDHATALALYRHVLRAAPSSRRAQEGAVRAALASKR